MRELSAALAAAELEAPSAVRKCSKKQGSKEQPPPTAAESGTHSSRCAHLRAQFRMCRVFHHPAIPHLDDAAAVPGIHFRMRHLNDRRSLLVQFAEKLHDLLRLA